MIWSITRECISIILEGSRSVHPREFAGFLRVEKHTRKISEVILLPGTVQGEEHAIFKLHMLPLDFTIVGTVHSHPSPNPYPSGMDLELFERFGRIHIIAAYPYDKNSWKAYDFHGNEIEVAVD